MGIFQHDGVNRGEIEHIVDSFPGQSIDFFGAMRARVYDDKVLLPLALSSGPPPPSALLATRTILPVLICGSQMYAPRTTCVTACKTRVVRVDG